MLADQALRCRTSLACSVAVLLAACSGDDSGGSDGGFAGEGGAAGTASGEGGDSAASGEGGGSGGGNVAGSAGAQGGGDGDGDGDGAEDGGGEGDGGGDGGRPDPITTCSAPALAASAGQECPLEGPVTLKLTPLLTGLEIPVLLTHAPDDESRLFLVMRDGRVLLLDPESGEVRSTFLELGSNLIAADATGGEYGLLGFAFHPSYPGDPRVFVNYTSDALDGGDVFDTLIASFEVSSNPDVVDMTSEQLLVRFGQPETVHNAGMLAFGPDHCLYSSSGDGGDDSTLAQDTATPYGKMLRIDVDAPAARAPGNLESAGYPHVWQLGLRNPWRFSFDRATGDLYIGDVGNQAHEEIDVTASGIGGQNFGWPYMEGVQCGDGAACDAYTPPTHDYAHVRNGATENCVIGGYVYRGPAIPSLYGWYVFGDAGEGHRIRAFVWDGAAPCEAPLALSERDGFAFESTITSFGEDAAGELYVLTQTGVYRIDPAD